MWRLIYIRDAATGTVDRFVGWWIRRAAARIEHGAHRWLDEHADRD